MYAVSLLLSHQKPGTLWTDNGLSLSVFSYNHCKLFVHSALSSRAGLRIAALIDVGQRAQYKEWFLNKRDFWQEWLYFVLATIYIYNKPASYHVASSFALLGIPYDPSSSLPTSP